jgi:hypothetical protein
MNSFGTGTMKELLNKIKRHGAAVVLSLVVVYGSVYVQQACCNTGTISCTPKSDIKSGAYTIGVSLADTTPHPRGNQTQLNLCVRDFLADMDAGVACCDTDRCGVDIPTLYFGTTFVQGNSPIQKILSLDDLIDGAQNSLEPANPSITRKSVPIHILTQSIIC